MRGHVRVVLLMLAAVFAIQQRFAPTRRFGEHFIPPVSRTITEVATDDANALVIPVVNVTRDQLRDSFGAPRVGHRHSAIDILAPRGTPVVAAVDGRIMKLYKGGAGGLTIYLADRDAKNVYYYAHLDHYGDVKEGKIVQRGQVIGYVGTTGNAPPGTPHLHFGIEQLPPTKQWWKGLPTNPYPILRTHGVTARL